MGEFTWGRGCPIIIWTGLNIKIGIIQKVIEWSSCPFANWSPDWRIILAKYQLGRSYIFEIHMPILIFSSVQKILGHPISCLCLELKIEWVAISRPSFSQSFFSSFSYRCFFIKVFHIIFNSTKTWHQLIWQINVFLSHLKLIVDV